jgi:hypothetical protein
MYLGHIEQTRVAAERALRLRKADTKIGVVLFIFPQILAVNFARDVRDFVRQRPLAALNRRRRCARSRS